MLYLSSDLVTATHDNIHLLEPVVGYRLCTTLDSPLVNHRAEATDGDKEMLPYDKVTCACNDGHQRHR